MRPRRRNVSRETYSRAHQRTTEWVISGAALDQSPLHRGRPSASGWTSRGAAVPEPGPTSRKSAGTRVIARRLPWRSRPLPQLLPVVMPPPKNGCNPPSDGTIWLVWRKRDLLGTSPDRSRPAEPDSRPNRPSRLPVASRRSTAFVPNHHRSRAVLTFGNHALEISVLKRVILRPDGQPPFGRVHGRTFGHCPRRQNALDRQAKVIVQTTGVMLLNDKDAPAPATPEAPIGLRRLSEPPLPAVLFEWHSVLEWHPVPKFCCALISKAPCRQKSAPEALRGWRAVVRSRACGHRA